VLQLVLQVVPRSVSGSPDCPSRHGLSYVSTLSIRRPRRPSQIWGQSAHQPAFGLR
jgi:hypothetical protein